MPPRDSCEFNGTRVTLLLGDITRQHVDGIVNAANSGLRGGGGVDGAIHRAGGPTIMDECVQIRKLQGGCPTGQAVITGAGRLQAKHVIHAVGPVWHGGHQGEAKLLADAYLNSLRLADEYNLKSVAFPAISAGVYHYPLAQAAEVAIGAVAQYCFGATGLTDIRFVLFNQPVFDAFATALDAACARA